MSNTTRFTSVQLYLESVDANGAALRSMAHYHKSVYDDNQEVLVTIEDPSFWKDLGAMLLVLVPFGQVIMAIQWESATLACVPQYWIANGSNRYISV
ncbi:hypothetical protein PLESTF_001722100 [Pleodorina starrii]|nr:hypothetical protein PLESTM_001409100 [Pleodorina starrii]GLC76028.1 hypothetical protein PLESTF_001722100 [Pleodorina starrii]